MTAFGVFAVTLFGRFFHALFLRTLVYVLVFKELYVLLGGEHALDLFQVVDAYVLCHLCAHLRSLVRIVGFGLLACLLHHLLGAGDGLERSLLLFGEVEPFKGVVSLAAFFVFGAFFVFVALFVALTFFVTLFIAFFCVLSHCRH